MSAIAVIDVETTGLFPYRHDRIIEIAAVVIAPSGEIVREFQTLINPQRDIGPTSIHGLTTADILEAPTFADAAGHLLEAIDGCGALAGHNIRFDHSFLVVEFDRLGAPLPDIPTLCTLRLIGGGDLASCCQYYDVPFDGAAHTAIHDARATARLLTKVLSDAPAKAREATRHGAIQWPSVFRGQARPLCRNESKRRQAEPPTFLKKLLGRVNDLAPIEAEDSALIAYVALLDRVLEDRAIDPQEGEALVEMAGRWGITGDQIQRTHHQYLLRLAAAALADGVVTESERRDLAHVARLLDVDLIEQVLKANLLESSSARIKPGLADDTLVGKTVCFTGECICRLDGELITRERAAELATEAGLVAVETVTKTLGVLVVADPLSQSGKAKKARQYGIRILHEPVFWSAVGVVVD